MGQSAHPGRTGGAVAGGAVAGGAVAGGAVAGRAAPARRAARRPGRAGRSRAAGALLAAALGSVGLAGCGTSVSAATTVLQRASDVLVVHPDGSVIRGVDGLRLHPGDVVRTGPGGRVDLHTLDRVVYLGSQASMQVYNGVHDALRHGAAVVDSLHGPGLRVDLAGLSLSVPSGSATRAERSVTVRVGSLAGPATVTNSVGRQVTVPALDQSIFGGDALPDTTTPLRLTDDDGEQHTVPALVHDDRELGNLADGIDSTRRAAVHVVTAAWHSGLLPTPPGVQVSEQVLPVLIAAAVHGDAAQRADRYRDAVALRAAGGSWGVVARRVGVDAAQVLAAFANYTATHPAGFVGGVPIAFAQLVTGATPGGPNGAGGAGGTGSGGNGSGGSGGGGSGGSPSPSPSPSGVVGTVDTLVNDVLGLLPTPTPSVNLVVPLGSAPPPAVSATPKATPKPTPTVSPRPVPVPLP
jgi:hypothetical protein